MAENQQNLQPDSPWLPRPARPDGTGRTESGRMPDAPLQPVLTAPVIEQLAQLIVRAHDKGCDTN